MKKNTFRKAGVAVLTMAMLLSTGALSAVNVSAADESITVAASTGLKAGDKVRVYQVAGMNASNKWEWKNGFGSVTGVPTKVSDIKDYDNDATEAFANLLAKNVSGKTFTRGSVGTAVSVSRGYYLVIAAPSEAGKIAQPMLIEVGDDARVTISNTKVSTITLDKTITAVTKGGTVKTGGKSAQAEKGAVVTYRLAAQIPEYDDGVTAADVQDYVLKDKCDATLTIDTDSITSFVAATKDAATGTAKGTVSGASATGFTVTMSGNDVLSNAKNYLIVTFNATVGDDPTIAQGKTDRTDANKNDAEVTYGNNFTTGGKSDTDGDGDIDEDDEQPKLEDYADVYASAVLVNKFKEDGTTVFPNVKFELHKDTATGEKVASASGTDLTDANGQIYFKGLDAGTYVLVEVKTNATKDYKTLDPITIEVTNTGSDSVFSATANGSALTLSANNDYNGGKVTAFADNITNEKLETLPATGGIGTYIFTIGGAAIVLLAGALFVVYMKKRRVEE